MDSRIQQLLSAVDDCMLHDQARLRGRVNDVRKTLEAGNSADKSLSGIRREIEASQEQRRRRGAKRPHVSFSDGLPVSRHREDIARALDRHQVIIVAGETGSGKTTQLPKICLDMGRGISGMIGHTQPRRIAARSVASRIAEELNTNLGDAVGYKVRFSDHSRPDSYIKLMTDGILLAELQSDKLLSQYDTLIIDEAHERSLNIDFLLGYLKKLLPRRPDMKLIITSATIDTRRFAKHFDNAPVIEVSGRSYPVEIRYRPMAADQEQDGNLISAILSAVDELAQHDGQGDILIFLNGERDIRDVAEGLRKHHPRDTEILPLFSRLSASEQQRIFQPSHSRRIVLSTNVAETSLTVPGIRYIIDPGTARISRYSFRSKVQRLPIEKISQSSAAQRAGRCGRVSHGVCIRLYSEDDFSARPEFTEPEIQRTNLAAVILQMRILGLGNPEEFPFIDSPDQRYINDGYRLLQELAALDEHRQLTHIGRQLARLPIDPRLGRMVIAAHERRCLSEMLVITSALSIQDPRERPVDKQQLADERHSRFRDDDSDFITLLNLWREYAKQLKKLSNNQLRKYCRRNFLSYMRMREWMEVYLQLRSQVKNLGMMLNEQEAEYADVHQAMLNGLLSHIGLRDDSASKGKPGKRKVKKLPRYQGTRDTEFYIFPGSALSKKNPRWIMSSELVETSRLFARQNARIEPEWIEPVAGHLLKYAYTEPYWDERRGRVSVSETLTLYGLILVAGRRRDYGLINAGISREIFIREALVKGRMRSRAAFYRHNQALINEVSQIEEKTRRRDVFAEEETLFQHFAALIPDNVCSVSQFDRWRKKAEKNNPDLLKLMRDDIIAKPASTDIHDYPGELNINDVTLPVTYCFNPGKDDDGVTVTVPQGALGQIPEEYFEWLVPGFLEEKLGAILKGLPKQLRKQLVPMPDSVRRMQAEYLTQCDKSSGLYSAISVALRHGWGIEIAKNVLRDIELAPHLYMRFRIVDAANKLVATGRDLALLKEQCARTTTSGQDLANLTGRWPLAGIKSWDFGELPAHIVIENTAGRYQVYPALVDKNDSVGIELLNTLDVAQRAHMTGLRRMVMLQLARDIKYLRRNLPGIENMCLQFSTLGTCEELKADILHAAVQECFFSDTGTAVVYAEIRTGEALDACITRHRASLVEVVNALCGHLSEILLRHHSLRAQMDSMTGVLPAEIGKDIHTQLDGLVYNGFLVDTPMSRLQHIPRYLSAIGVRLDKLASDAQIDIKRMARLRPFLAIYQGLKKESCINPLALQKLRWMLEEYRVSLFAQQLKTATPISPQRLERQIAACRD